MRLSSWTSPRRDRREHLQNLANSTNLEASTKDLARLSKMLLFFTEDAQGFQEIKVIFDWGNEKRMMLEKKLHQLTSNKTAKNISQVFYFQITLKVWFFHSHHDLFQETQIYLMIGLKAVFKLTLMLEFSELKVKILVLAISTLFGLIGNSHLLH